jgi:hypothetical protein
MASISVALAMLVCTLVLTACSRPAAGEAPQVGNGDPEGLTFTVSVTPSPIDNATTRYTDFSYHIRPVGAVEYMVFAPAKVEPTKDRSVLATFEVTLPSVKANQLYESFHAWKVDGREEISNCPTEALIGDVVDGGLPGSTHCR